MLSYFTEILTNVAIFGLLGLGLDVQWGWGGMLNLTYITFAAAGAYVYAFFTLPPASAAAGEHYLMGLHLPFLVGVVGAMLAGACLSAAIGSVALKRVRPEYFAIVTLSIGLVIFQLVSQITGFANGQVGIYAIPSPLDTATWINQTYYPQVFLGICLVFLVAAILVVQRLHGSAWGRALRATRDSSSASSALGYSSFRVQLSGFIFGGALAGIGGALLAAHLTAFNPGAWSPSETFLIYVAVLVGGKGRPLGVLLGTVLLTGVLQEVTRYIPAIPGHPDAVAAIRLLTIGLVILVVLRWRPQGLLPERNLIDRDGSEQPPGQSSLGATEIDGVNQTAPSSQTGAEPSSVRLLPLSGGAA